MIIEYISTISFIRNLALSLEENYNCIEKTFLEIQNFNDINKNKFSLSNFFVEVLEILYFNIKKSQILFPEINVFKIN